MSCQAAMTAESIHDSCLDGDLTGVLYWLKKGQDINFADKEGNRPIHLAALSGNAQLLKLLIDQGAKVNVKGRKGMMPIHMALIDANQLVVCTLLEVRLRQREQMLIWAAASLRAMY